eukprot:TRINITY_DN16844_c0_g1_i1.p1 TRINITY_DN16844_c0_g1~~TRINITY_DN16844_c0_g1_i1.p1  ORF type:complete len:840 (-),score=175.41 TRINITY_DN16844_c0_g1_i1:76-2556(-)
MVRLELLWPRMTSSTYERIRPRRRLRTLAARARGRILACLLLIVSGSLAADGKYLKIVGGRCAEYEGVLPFGGKDKNWTKGLDDHVRNWCDRRGWCVGYMRYLGDDPEHAAAWRGRPLFCHVARFTADENWASYVRQDAFRLEGLEGALAGAGNGGPEEVSCPWPYAGSVRLWFRLPDESELQEKEEASRTEEEQGDGKSDASDREDTCNVLFHRRGEANPREESEQVRSFFDGVLSESDEVVQYFTADTSRTPWTYSIDSGVYIGETAEGGSRAFGPKRHYLSVFFTSAEARCDGKNAGDWSPENAEEVFPGHVYVEDGSGDVSTRRKAFNEYHFTVICSGPGDDALIPQALIDAVGFAAHPLVYKDIHEHLHRAFFHLPDAAQPFTRMHPVMLEKYIEDLYTDPAKNNAMYFKQTFLFLLQELFRYRYRQGLPQRLTAAACALCGDRARHGLLEAAAAEAATALNFRRDASAIVAATAAELGAEAAEQAAANAAEAIAAADRAAASAGLRAVSIAVCVMSRRSGVALRDAIRETWATRAAGQNVALRFFVGGAGEGDDAAADADRGDVVELEVPEAYSAVTLKAFSMLAWARSAFPNLRFLVRADDDVYLRPGPLIAQLEKRPPVAYLWGNFDHGSNPVRDPAHPHYNSQEQFPERKHPLFGDIFPPYARGNLWAMSADLLTMVAEVWRGELAHARAAGSNVSLELAKRLPHPDDPALGVALSNLVDQDKLSLNIDDRDLNHFALNPSCNATYLNIHRRTWAVHHVDVKAMRCMWAIDQAAEEMELDREEKVLPDLCPCSMAVEEEEDEFPDEPFDYPRDRFNE